MATLDRNGELVHRFSLHMQNLGFQRMADELVTMLDSGVWTRWRDGSGEVVLLPGEYDYFLSMCGITRDMVMTGIRDMEAKARIAEAMDERRAGEDDYRRAFPEVKAALGRRDAEPFGFTQAERAAVESAFDKRVSRYQPALGSRVRRYVRTGEADPPSFKRNKMERLQAAVRNLKPDEAAEFDRWYREHVAR